jgi:branched-subunit amino acid transport protein AzlD
MNEYHILFKKILLLAEVTAAIVGIIKFRKFKDSYWKWFICYLVFIAISETLSKFVFHFYEPFMSNYYSFFVIPLEFITIFWLYSYKSLNRKKLFWISVGIYLVSLLPYYTLEDNKMVKSLNFTIGGFLISIMIILEYSKQMKSDDILKFRENMMFYINAAVGLFYVGTLPFFAFYNLLLNDMAFFYDYYMFFLITNILMYTLFSIALLWGKPNTY